MRPPAESEEQRARRKQRERIRHARELGMAAVVLGFLWGLANSPLLYITHVDLLAPDRETYALAARTIRVPADASSLFYPVSRIERQVASIPRIERVEIERRLRHGLQVRVYRRQPVAVVPAADDCFLVSADGVLTDRLAPGRRWPLLPVMAGLSLPDAQPGDRLDEWPAWLVAQSTRFAAAAGLSGPWQLDCSHPFELRLRTGTVEGFLGGTDNLERKVHLYASLLQELKKRGKRPAYIDVRVLERPVWREAGAEPTGR